MKRTIIAGLLMFGMTMNVFASNKISDVDKLAIRDALMREDEVRLAEIWFMQPGELTSLHAMLSSVDDESSEIRPQYIWTIAKRALIWALRNHTDTIVKKLPAKWRGPVGKNARALADLIEKFDEWKEGACIIGLTSMGIPPSDSQIMCQAISFLL